MLTGIIQRLRSVAGRILNRVRTAIREATRPLPVFAGLVADITRSRTELLMENALLRQQLIVASKSAILNPEQTIAEIAEFVADGDRSSFGVAG